MENFTDTNDRSVVDDCSISQCVADIEDHAASRGFIGGVQC